MSVHASKVLPESSIILALSGIIGAGKTTFADKLGEKLGWKVYHELGPDENDLRLFYADMKKQSFVMQIRLLTKRLRQYSEMIGARVPAIVDRTLEEDTVFARVLRDGGNMTEYEYETYLGLAGFVHDSMRRPTVLIHLDVPPEVALERIGRRGRTCETGITIEYLRELWKAYEVFLDEISLSVPVIRVDWTRFADVGEVIEMVMEELRSPTRTARTVLSPKNVH